MKTSDVVVRLSTIAEIRRADLTLRQLAVFCAVYDSSSDWTERTDIQRQTALSGPAMTRIIDKLFNLGWIERHVFPQDRRKLWVGLTERGRQVAVTVVAVTDLA